MKGGGIAHVPLAADKDCAELVQGIVIGNRKSLYVFAGGTLLKPRQWLSAPTPAEVEKNFGLLVHAGNPSADDLSAFLKRVRKK
jgi:hypothetical protein